MSGDDLNRVEETITAINSGNLEPEGHAHSCVLALGLSGQRNKLGAAVLHMIEHPNAPNRMLVVFHLAGELERRGLCRGRDSVDVAGDAVKWYEAKRCPKCEGRGVMDMQQTICRECSGKGERKRPGSMLVDRAIAAIEDALNWLEQQQRKRLGRDGEVLVREPLYALPGSPRTIQHADEMPECGAVTRKCPTDSDHHGGGY